MGSYINQLGVMTPIATPYAGTTGGAVDCSGGVELLPRVVGRTPAIKNLILAPGPGTAPEVSIDSVRNGLEDWILALTGLRSYYRLGELAGPLQDRGPANNPLAPAGAVVRGAPSMIVSDPNASIQTASATFDYAIGGAVPYDFNAGIGVAGRARYVGLGNDSAMFSKAASSLGGGDSTFFLQSSSGRNDFTLSLFLSDLTNVVLDSNTVINDGLPHTVGFSFDPLTGAVVLYSDGVAVNSALFPGTVPFSSSVSARVMVSGISEGAAPFARWWDGGLDEWALVARPLSAAEHLLYHQFATAVALSRKVVLGGFTLGIPMVVSMAGDTPGLLGYPGGNLEIGATNNTPIMAIAEGTQ